MNKLEQIAVELFKLDDWFMGCKSGGVESPRVILGITTETDGDDALVVISFTYQEDLYHDLEAGKKMEQVYRFSKGSVACDGADVFRVDPGKFVKRKR